MVYNLPITASLSIFYLCNLSNVGERATQIWSDKKNVDVDVDVDVTPTQHRANLRTAVVASVSTSSVSYS